MYFKQWWWIIMNFKGGDFNWSCCFRYSCIASVKNTSSSACIQLLNSTTPSSLYLGVNIIRNTLLSVGESSNIPSLLCLRLFQQTRPVAKSSHQIRSDQSLSRVRLCDPMNHSMPGLPVLLGASEALTSCRCRPPSSVPLLLPPIPPSIRVFSNESTLHMRWPKYWSFSFSIIPSKKS